MAAADKAPLGGQGNYPYFHMEVLTDFDFFFEESRLTLAFSTQDSTFSTPVELQVTNLDQNIDQREMKRTILAIFREHVNVLHVSVFFQSDGNMAASVRVGSVQVRN